MSDALLPCPFCGGEAMLGRDDEGAQGIGCKACGAGTRAFYPLKDDVTQLAAEAWNRRAAVVPAVPASPSDSITNEMQADEVAFALIQKRAAHLTERAGQEPAMAATPSPSVVELLQFLRANVGSDEESNIEIKATWQHGQSLASLLAAAEKELGL